MLKVILVISFLLLGTAPITALLGMVIEKITGFDIDWPTIALVQILIGITPILLITVLCLIFEILNCT
jgi:hypothetical protein